MPPELELELDELDELVEPVVELELLELLLELDVLLLEDVLLEELELLLELLDDELELLEEELLEPPLVVGAYEHQADVTPAKAPPKFELEHATLLVKVPYANEPDLPSAT